MFRSAVLFAPFRATPVYVNIDAAHRLPRIGRRSRRVGGLDVRDAKNIVLLMERMSRDLENWNCRIALAEHLGARVITDFKTGSTFPTAHVATVCKPGYFPDADAKPPSATQT